MQIKTLINGATSNITSEPIKLDRVRQNMAGNIPIQVQISGTATVTLEASLSHADIDTAVREGTALWTSIANGIYNASSCDALSVAFPYIRAVVSGYASGSVTVTVDI
jgi:hypothetical protein